MIVYFRFGVVLPVALGGDTKYRQCFISGVCARGINISHIEVMCNLSWNSPPLEKDNSKNKPVYNTQVCVVTVSERLKEEERKIFPHTKNSYILMYVKNSKDKPT